MLIQVVNPCDDSADESVAILEVPENWTKPTPFRRFVGQQLNDILQQHWDTFMEGGNEENLCFQEFVLSKQKTWKPAELPKYTVIEVYS